MTTIRRARLSMPILLAGLFALAPAGPASGHSAGKAENLTADLDGKRIELVDVGHWYCHDFDYPVIHCFSDPKAELESSKAALATTAVTYVTVYEFTTYQGAFMHMSQNYSILSLIGWSDRISSFEVLNGMSGAFWTDWLYSGTRYNFCCNSSVGSLGGFNDTFSSVFHN